MTAITLLSRFDPVVRAGTQTAVAAPLERRLSRDGSNAARPDLPHGNTRARHRRRFPHAARPLTSKTPGIFTIIRSLLSKS